MFKKLRNRLILMNLGITSIVILVTFSVIYLVSTRTANDRPPISMEMNAEFDAGTEKIIATTIREEKQAAAKDLLVALIVSGLAIEVAVAIISYFLAEEAIKPVREAYQSQKIFIANASHEIKTPLAAIAANLEAADIHDNKWIANIETETAKLTALNAELLTLARTDLVTNSQATEADLALVVRETLKSFNPRMQNLKISEKISKTEKVKINREDFTQILSILLDNAVKYAGTKVHVELNTHQLVVKNDGAKISDKDLPHIFERFYQADKSAEGVGLGLSIAKSLAERNGWKLSAESQALTSFTLEF